MLPKIAHHGNDSNRNSYHTITKDDAISETDENTLGTDNKFEESNDKLASLVFPTMNPAATVKQRIALLEGSAEQQNEFDRLTHDTFCNLSNNLSNTDQVLRGVIIDVQKAMDEKLAAFKKEYDHLFELQASENKRLQHHIASLKSESNQVKKKLISTAEKLKRMQIEFGDIEDGGDDEDVFSLTGPSLISRPNTVMLVTLYTLLLSVIN